MSFSIRVQKLFKLIDDYAGKKMFNELNIKKVGLLLKDCDRVKGAMSNICIATDSSLLKLEGELRWLYDRMMKNNIIVVVRGEMFSRYIRSK